MLNSDSKIKQNIQEGIPLIKEWIEVKRQAFENNTDFNELIRVIKEIEKDQDFSKDAFEDIRYLLRPFEYIPLKIKRLFNIGTLDNYTLFIASRHFESIEDFINLECCTKRFNGNMTKFHYNPIPLNERTRTFFDHLQTLFIYSRDDNQFEEDPRIIAREQAYMRKYISLKEQKQLEEWTGLKCKGIVFD